MLGPEVGLPAAPLWCLLEDDEGVLWGGGLRGVWRATDAANTRFRRVEGAPDRVQAMARDERGAFWFGCPERLFRWTPDSSSATAVAEGKFITFCEDSRGTLWTGSLGRGLHSVRYAPLHDATATFGVPADNTWVITGSPSGTVFLLYDRFMMEVRDGEVTERPFPHNITSALVDRRGHLWVGKAGGLLRLDGTVPTELGEETGLTGTVRALLEGEDGALWIGTTLGLYRLSEERCVRQGPEELTGIRCVLEDPDTGTIWVGTDEGLARLVGDSFTRFARGDGLSPGVVRALHLDPDGVLWVGTYGGGLSRYRDGVFTRYSKEVGLTDNYLSCILEDDDERLWINSNSGPFVVHRTDLNRFARGETDHVACISFTREEGAREANGGNQPAGWRTADGRMWFPTIEGATIADPAELPLDETPPSVLIESVEIDDRRAFEARFTALGFSSPNRVRVQYRLLGHRSSWIECTGERLAMYSYLSPGDYELQVRARNGYGPWSEVVGETFSVEARFHETATFLVVMAVLVATGAFALAERRVKRSRARTAELVQLVEEREKAQRSLRRSQTVLRRLSRELLTSQESERRRLSRELHDDVTQRLAALAIQAELAEARLGEDADRSHDHLRDIVEKTQQLAGDVQLLSRRLHPVGLRTLGLSEAIRQECDAFTRRSGVEAEVRSTIASEEVPENVAVAAFRILQESLHNIEKHAATGRVRIAAAMTSGLLVLSISDEGRGFDPEAEDELGLGLVTMRERAASIGGELSIVSRSGEGTTVRLSAPGRRREA